MHKDITRSVSVWILGVQRDANEVKRNLLMIPANTAKPKAEKIMTLGIGEFYACFGRSIHKTYVRPAWMDERTAWQIAKGQKTIADVETPAAWRQREWREETPAHKTRAIAIASPALTIHVPQPKETTVSQLPNPQALVDLQRALDALGVSARSNHAPPTASQRSTSPAMPADEEQLYQRIKSRLIDEAPAILKLIAEGPELVVEVQRQTYTYDAKKGDGGLAQLIVNGWLDKPVSGHAVWVELKRLGYKVAKPSVYDWAKKMAARGFLTIEGDGFKAVSNMKRRIEEK
jgi:hypothetical protein